MNALLHDDPLADLFGRATGAGQYGPEDARPVPPASYVPAAERVFNERCSRCGGAGQYGRLGPCFKCQGSGRLAFKSAPEHRAARRAAGAKKRANRAVETQAAAEAWKKNHAAEWTWLVEADRRANAKGYVTWEFPGSLIEAVHKWGALTDGQLAAVRRFAARDAERAAERAQTRAAAPAVDVSKLLAAFARARGDARRDGEGVKWLRLRLDTFVFYDAPGNDRWPAAVIVHEGDTKLGKIVAGRFERWRACDDATAARVLAACADPAAAAVAYGLRTKSCAVCGAELTNAVSRARGIGPICAERFGF